MIKVFKIKLNGSISMLIENSTTSFIALSVCISLFTMIVNNIYLNKNLIFIKNEYIQTKILLQNNQNPNLENVIFGDYIIFRSSYKDITIKNLKKIPTYLHTNIGISHDEDIQTIDDFFKFKNNFENKTSKDIYYIFNINLLNKNTTTFHSNNTYIINYGEYNELKNIPIEKICNNGDIPTFKLFPSLIDYNQTPSFNLELNKLNNKLILMVHEKNQLNGMVNYKLLGVCHG